MTGPHGSQPTAAPQGAVCTPMPAGKPSAQLEEVLQLVLQGLSRGEEPGAAPRVAVLLDRPQPHLSNWLGPALGACELIVCMMQEEQEEQDGCPEALHQQPQGKTASRRRRRKRGASRGKSA